MIIRFWAFFDVLPNETGLLEQVANNTYQKREI